MRTIADVQADLDAVNSALTEVIAGRRVNRLLLRSADFQREYFNQAITESFLMEWRDRLMQELDDMERIAGDHQITFRPQTTIPLLVTKFGTRQ